MNLTGGALPRMLAGEKVPAPNLQVLETKNISKNSVGRYRILLSDGEYANSFAVLSRKLNPMIEEKIINRYTIIRVENYISISRQVQRKTTKVIYLLDVSVLIPGDQVAQIGSPKPFPSLGAGDLKRPKDQHQPLNHLKEDCIVSSEESSSSVDYGPGDHFSKKHAPKWRNSPNDLYGEDDDNGQVLTGTLPKGFTVINKKKTMTVEHSIDTDTTLNHSILEAVGLSLRRATERKIYWSTEDVVPLLMMEDPFDKCSEYLLRCRTTELLQDLQEKVKERQGDKGEYVGSPSPEESRYNPKIESLISHMELHNIVIDELSETLQGRVDEEEIMLEKWDKEDQDNDRESTNERSARHILDIPGNMVCCDCGDDEPNYVSVNFGVTLCIECGVVHRSLGEHITKVRSITGHAWEPEILKVVAELGNTIVNKILEGDIGKRNLTKPDANSDSITRKLWITSKYKEKAFVNRTTAFKYRETTTWVGPTDSLAALTPELLLYRAASSHNLPAMFQAIALGSNLDWQNQRDYRRSAIHQTIESGSEVALEFLILNGAKTTSVDTKGDTALHMAAMHGNEGQVRLLIKHNADRYMENNDGKQPLDIAVENSDEDIVNLLRFEEEDSPTNQRITKLEKMMLRLVEKVNNL